MGNCIKKTSNNDSSYMLKYFNKSISSSSKNIKQKFIKYNVIDIDKDIIIGVFNNPDKSNTLGNQGIWIGQYDKIYSLKFGMYHKAFNMVILTFENNIKFKLTKNENNLEFVLEINNETYTKQLDANIIKNLKEINYDSLDLDLIFNLLN